jgi:hypothetical protein
MRREETWSKKSKKTMGNPMGILVTNEETSRKSHVTHHLVNAEIQHAKESRYILQTQPKFTSAFATNKNQPPT